MTEDAMETIGRLVAEGRLIPYLGPDLLTLAGAAPVPTAPRELAARLAAKISVPARIRGNVWSVAQYIESNRHRITLTRLMSETFGPALPPTALHRWLAELKWLPLVVDVWYDDTLPAAFAGRRNWGLVQGVTRAGENLDIWAKYFDCAGRECQSADAPGWQTLVYKPHGCVRPGGSFLVSDSDYVEALTELDIQTPIPPEVQARRAGRGFLFLGCRFYDQMLRTYARQIMKRSSGPHYAVLPEADLTRNERRFLEEQAIVPVGLDLGTAVDRLTKG
ncbi:MAG: SIR2 family protein [Magnetospirillum sp. WYHS-4]